MDIQRLRNLTTGIIHTKMCDACEDIDRIVGMAGSTEKYYWAICQAIKPYLIGVVSDARFWNEKLDRSHVGQVEIPVMTREDVAVFFKHYAAYKKAFAESELYERTRNHAKTEYELDMENTLSEIAEIVGMSRSEFNPDVLIARIKYLAKDNPKMDVLMEAQQIISGEKQQNRRPVQF